MVIFSDCHEENKDKVLASHRISAIIHTILHQTGELSSA